MLLLIDSHFFSLKIDDKTFLARSWDIDAVLFFFFFLKSCSSEAIFPALTIFIPVKRSPSMDCTASDGAGFVTQSGVSFILQARWSTEKDGFTYRASRRGAVSPILETVEARQGTTSPGKPFSGVSERSPVNHLAESLYWGPIGFLPLPQCTPTDTGRPLTLAYVY